MLLKRIGPVYVVTIDKLRLNVPCAKDKKMGD